VERGIGISQLLIEYKYKMGVNMKITNERIQIISSGARNTRICTECGKKIDEKSYNAGIGTCNICRYNGSYIDKYENYQDYGINNIDQILAYKLGRGEGCEM